MLTRLLTVAALVAATSPAYAHLKVTSHLSRYGDSAIKVGPCGVADGARSGNVYIGKPGIDVQLTWDEYINHPGYFRIDFDLDGDDDFADPILPCADQNSIADCFDTTDTGPFMVNNIPDTQGGISNFTYTLPDQECDNCTLQVIQVMQDKPPYVTPGNDIYYQCIDIILANDGPDVLTLVDAPDAGPTGSDGGGGDGDGGSVDSGCGCKTNGGGGSTLALFLVAGLLAWRRRR